MLRTGCASSTKMGIAVVKKSLQTTSTDEEDGAGICTCDDKDLCNSVYTGASTKTGLKCLSCKGDKGRKIGGGQSPRIQGGRSYKESEANPMSTGDLTKGEIDSSDLLCDDYVRGDAKYEVYCNHYASVARNQDYSKSPN